MAVDDHGIEVLKKAGETTHLNSSTKVDYFHKVSEPLRRMVRITEVVNSQLTFIGYALDFDGFTSDLTSLKAEAVWQIVRILGSGNDTEEAFAEKDSVMHPGFVHVWDDRESLFPTPVLSNPASLLFDGVDERINLGNNYDFGPAQAFSWAWWFKADNFAAQRAFIAKTTQDTNVFGYSFQHNSSGQIFSQFRALGTLRQHTFSTVMTAGIWTFGAATYAGGSNMNGLTVYIDGVSEGAASAGSLNDWNNAADLMIASRGTVFHFSGNMNHVSVWNKELSQSEITELYNSGTPGDLNSHSAVANLQSWWFLNDDSNFPTEVDQIGSVNGTLVNMEVGDYDAGDVP